MKGSHVRKDRMDTVASSSSITDATYVMNLLLTLFSAPQGHIFLRVLRFQFSPLKYQHLHSNFIWKDGFQSVADTKRATSLSVLKLSCVTGADLGGGCRGCAPPLR